VTLQSFRIEASPISAADQTVHLRSIADQRGRPDRPSLTRLGAVLDDQHIAEGWHAPARGFHGEVARS
jgi:hypothetical protein